MRFFVNLLLLTIVGIIQAGAQENTSKLEEVLVLFRYGDRTHKPSECFPNDTASNMLSHDYKLSEKGKTRMLNLGKRLSSTYSDLLKDYCQECVYARTLIDTPAEESLRLVLESIYPNETIAIVQAQPKVEDFTVSRRCSKFNALLNETYSNPNVKIELDGLKDFFSNLTKATGISNMDLKKALLLANLMEVRVNSDVTLPVWYVNNTPNALKEVVKQFYKIYTYQPEMKIIAAAPVLGALLKEIRTTAKVQKRLSLFSVDQEQIESFLQGIGLGVDKETSFGSAIILEKLRTADNKIEIRFKYYKGEGEEFETLTLNGCPADCPLDILSNIVKPIIEVRDIAVDEDPNSIDVLQPIYQLCAVNVVAPENDLDFVDNYKCN